MDNRPCGSQQPDDQKGVSNDDLLKMLTMLVEVQKRNERNRRGGRGARALITGIGMKEIAEKVKDVIEDAF